MGKLNEANHPGKVFIRLTTKDELAEAMRRSPKSLERWMLEGKIARPAIVYNARSKFFTPWQANEILAGRTGHIRED